MNRVHLELNSEDDSEESGGANDLIEEMVGRGEDSLLAVGEKDFDFEDVVADWARIEGIFTVEVHAEGAAEGWEHGSADDRGPEAGFKCVPPDLFEGNSGLAVNDAGLGVEV